MSVLEEIKAGIRNIPDFPVKGVQFKDITTILKNPLYLRELRDIISSMYKDKGITQVVGLESRGFILAPAVAIEIGAGFVPQRKPGKLPYKTLDIEYEKEYGRDKMQMHSDALTENDIVLIHDDLLATGGSLKATVELVKKFNVKKIYVNVLIELDELKGKETLDNDVEFTSLIHFT